MRTNCRRSGFILACVGLIGFYSIACAEPDAPPTAPILGFSPAHSKAERAIEKSLQDGMSPDRLQHWHRVFTAEPHPAASQHHNKLADLMAQESHRQGGDEVTRRR